MDTDWCLTCDRHIEGNGLYCSTHCQSQAGPSSYRSNIPPPSSSHSDDDSYDSSHPFSSKSQWIGNGSAGIIAWAAAVPSGPPIDEPVSSSAASAVSTTFRAPKLLRPNRPVPPALCMSSSNPTAASPARPIATTQSRNSNFSTPISSADQSKTSLRSGPSDSSVSTPSSSHPILISTSRKPDLFASVAHASWISPSPPPSAFKHTIPPLVHRRPEQNFAVLTRTTRSSTLNNIVCSSSQTSLEDNTLPLWWVSGTVADAATKGVSRRGLLIRDEQPPHKTRGRRASRVAA